MYNASRYIVLAVTVRENELQTTDLRFRVLVLRPLAFCSPYSLRNHSTSLLPHIPPSPFLAFCRIPPVVWTRALHGRIPHLLLLLSSSEDFRQTKKIVAVFAVAQIVWAARFGRSEFETSPLPFSLLLTVSPLKRLAERCA